MDPGVALPYSRPLDGVRGVAVLAVLLFHGGVTAASGGFLGVSLFFTLSGYLITQLLVREHEEAGRISLRRFWSRRLRRLLPASLLCITAVALTVRFTDVFGGGDVRADLLAAMANVANWHFAFEQASYAELFTAGPSPVLHFWSLAIEEQFYLGFPILVAAIAAAAGGRRRLALGAVFVGLLVASSAGATLAGSDDLAYYGTHARAVELLAGALLALALPLGATVGSRAAPALAAAGVAAAAVFAVLVAAATTESGWVYGGGLAPFSLVSVALLAGATVPGPVRWLCSRRPLVALGLVSYGVYVFHWPLFLVLSPERTGLQGLSLLGVRLAVTVALAASSYVLVEQPVRRQHLASRPLRLRPLLAGGMATTVVAVGFAVPASGGGDITEIAALAAPDRVVSFGSTTDRSTDGTLDVLVLGSEADVPAWIDGTLVGGRRARVRNVVQPGCPVRENAPVPPCRPFTQVAAEAMVAGLPDLVVVGVGTPDRERIAERTPDALPGPTGPRRDLSEELMLRAIGAAHWRPLLFVDTVGGEDALAVVLREGDLEVRDVTTVVAPLPGPHDLGAAMAHALAGADAELRLVVIGDSTSYGIAEAIDAVAGDRVEVLWAGRHNCAIPRLERLRWWPGTEWPKDECPSVEHLWPDAIRRVQPHALVIAASLPEMAEQKYPAVDGWHVPGTEAYRRAHDEVMEQLQELLAPTGAVTVVLNAPPITSGGFARSRMAQPERLDGWNEQIARWDGAWQSVGVVDWSAILTEAEAARGASLRGDGVHLRAPDLAAITEARLLPELEAVIAELRRATSPPPSQDRLH